MNALLCLRKLARPLALVLVLLLPSSLAEGLANHLDTKAAHLQATEQVAIIFTHNPLSAAKSAAKTQSFYVVQPFPTLDLPCTERTKTKAPFIHNDERDIFFTLPPINAP